MKKILTAALAALTLAGGAAATASPADAAGFHGGGFGGFHGGYRGGYGYGYGHGYRGGGALVAGLAGLAVGAALVGGDHYDYGPSGYYAPYPAYYGDYGYAPYGVCYSARQVWDPYVGHYVVQRYRYAC